MSQNITAVAKPLISIQLVFLLRPVKAISHASPLHYCPPNPPPFIPQPSHPLSTPLAPTIPLSPHRPTLNRLPWNLFKYFDISPPLTSRAEMICDSWRWARSEELPPTPGLLFSPPLLLCRKADFSLSTLVFFSSSFILCCSSCQLAQALKAPLLFFFSSSDSTV